MEKQEISDLKLGIIAGGQLGKMLSLAAANWDIETFVLDGDEKCPAGKASNHFIKGDYRDYEAVYQFGKQVDLLTFEIENVNSNALHQLEKEGLKIYPSPKTLDLIKDKGLQKAFYKKHNIPSSPFELYESKTAILDAIAKNKIEFPVVQKLRTGGYDGRGVLILKDKNAVDEILEGDSLIEKAINIKKEISVIVARNKNGEVKCFPLVEMEFNEKANLVEKLLCPATQPDFIHEKAKTLAIEITSKLDFIGLLAVEMFVDVNDKVWVNEIAPRPHNSGHHTIEGLVTSQYEQMLRAILNLPLGSTAIKMPAVMINLLGEPEYEGKVKYEGLAKAMEIEGVKIHLYGKKITRPYRKMGHVTVLAKTIEEASAKADLVKHKLKVIS